MLIINTSIKKLFLIALALIVSVADFPVKAETGIQTSGYNGIQIVGLPKNPNTNYDVSILPPKKAMARITKAIEVIYKESTFNRKSIDLLKSKRRVIIVYDPDHYQEQMGYILAATFRPDAPEISEISDGREQLVATVTRHGIKWPIKELAAALVHELVGHGLQHISGRLKEMRELELECEARLRQEQAFQDFKMNKSSQEMIGFRQVLEEHYCKDFKSYLRSTSSNSIKLWNTTNPDVPKILALFEIYVENLRKSGALRQSANALEKYRGEALTKLIKYGRPEEQYFAALYFLEESNNPKHLRLALTLLHYAANQGFDDAQYRLGKAYEESNGGGEKAGELAVQWYKEASDQGHITAQFALGRLLENGGKVAKNPVEAATWYQTAANGGHVGAQYRLGLMLAKGLGVEKAPDIAAKWYQKAAESGHPSAQSAIGYLYEKGIGVPKDLKKALYWYKKGAVQGYAKPQFNIGVMYSKGRGTTRDDRQAVKWIYQAAAQDYPRAQRVLGLMFQKGMGVNPNPAKALIWYNKAAKHGDKKAAKLAAILKSKHTDLAH